MAKELPASWVAWIDKLAKEGGPVARDQDLPVAAMLACAATECHWGTSSIYKLTGNPFNLQKWPQTLFPHTHKTHWNRTMVEKGPPPVFANAPFNCALNLADAALQWCEWIVHYGRADGPGSIGSGNAKAKDNPIAIARKEQLLTHRNNSLDFSFYLPLVGFGENKTSALQIKSGKGYQDCLRDNGLSVYD